MSAVSTDDDDDDRNLSGRKVKGVTDHGDILETYCKHLCKIS